MNDIELRTRELELALSRFRVDQLERYALPTFPETTCRSVARLLARRRLPMRATHVARILAAVAEECGVDAEEMDDRIARLKLSALAVNSNREWHCYRLSEPVADFRLITSSTLAPRVGRELRSALRERRLRPEVHTLRHGDYHWLSITLVKVSSASTSPPLYLAHHVQEGLLFSSKKPANMLLEPIQLGLGYRSCKDLFLKGKDLPSLRRILLQKENVNLTQLLGRASYEPKPVITNQGIDYTCRTYKERYVSDLIGPDPPLLNSLEVQAEEPFYDDQVPGFEDRQPIKMKVTLRSENVAETLKEMVKLNVISPDSVWFNFFQGTSRNQLRLRNVSRVTE